MKIQCNVCEASEAMVLCCADEAALCWECDEKIHAANKLAGKHQRVPLTRASSSHVPKCDICQEASGYFFCLEDRALLCRKCDIAIHSLNSFVSSHQRFLLTGVKVGQELPEPATSSAEKQMSPATENAASVPDSVSKRSSTVSLSKETTIKDSFGSKYLFTGGGDMSGSSPGWPLDEFFGFTDFGQTFGFADHGSSKADSGSFGSMEGSPTYRSSEEEFSIHCLGVPDMQHMVPQLSSPPTASGMHWMKNPYHQLIEDSAFVPDISSGPPDLRQCQHGSPTPKRRRLHKHLG